MIRPESLDVRRREAQKVANEYGLPIHIYRVPGPIETYMSVSNKQFAIGSLVETVEPTVPKSAAPSSHGRFEIAAAERSTEKAK